MSSMDSLEASEQNNGNRGFCSVLLNVFDYYYPPSVVV